MQCQPFKQLNLTARLDQQRQKRCESSAEKQSIMSKSLCSLEDNWNHIKAIKRAQQLTQSPSNASANIQPSLSNFSKGLGTKPKTIQQSVQFLSKSLSPRDFQLLAKQSQQRSLLQTTGHYFTNANKETIKEVNHQRFLSHFIGKIHTQTCRTIVQPSFYQYSSQIPHAHSKKTQDFSRPPQFVPPKDDDDSIGPPNQVSIMPMSLKIVNKKKPQLRGTTQKLRITLNLRNRGKEITNGNSMKKKKKQKTENRNEQMKGAELEERKFQVIKGRKKYQEEKEEKNRLVYMEIEDIINHQYCVP